MKVDLCSPSHFPITENKDSPLRQSSTNYNEIFPSLNSPSQIFNIVKVEKLYHADECIQGLRDKYLSNFQVSAVPLADLENFGHPYCNDIFYDCFSGAELGNEDYIPAKDEDIIGEESEEEFKSQNC